MLFTKISLSAIIYIGVKNALEIFIEKEIQNVTGKNQL